jgi:hypothetical protein
MKVIGKPKEAGHDAATARLLKRENNVDQSPRTCPFATGIQVLNREE